MIHEAVFKPSESCPATAAASSAASSVCGNMIQNFMLHRMSVKKAPQLVLQLLRPPLSKGTVSRSHQALLKDHGRGQAEGFPLVEALSLSVVY